MSLDRWIKNKSYKCATQQKRHACYEVGLVKNKYNYSLCENIFRRRFTTPIPKRSASAKEPYIAIEIGIPKGTNKNIFRTFLFS